MLVRLAGALFGLLHAILTVPLGLSQHVSGLGITLFATSVSYYTYRTVLPNVSSPPRIEPFRPLDIPVLSDLPFLGPVLFQQTALTWLAILFVMVMAMIVVGGLTRLTDSGLSITEWRPITGAIPPMTDHP